MNIKRFYKYKNWYSKTRQLLKRKYGKDYILIAGLLASTSPRFQVKRNYNTAIKIYDNFIKNKENYYNYAVNNKAKYIKENKILLAHYYNILKVLNNNINKGKALILNGNKVNAFYNNLIGNYNHVTIDIWIIRYFNIKDKSQLNKSEYKYYSKAIIKYAKRLKLYPCQCQAIIWEYQRHKENKKPSNFYEYIEVN